MEREETKLNDLKIGGRLKAEFLARQAELNPEIALSIAAFSSEAWFKLIGIKGKFGRMTNEILEETHRKAQWLVDCDYIKVFHCANCGKIVFYCREIDIINSKTGYYDMVINKSTCHSFETDFARYGSSYDGEKLKIDLCETCYEKMSLSA